MHFFEKIYGQVVLFLLSLGRFQFHISGPFTLLCVIVSVRAVARLSQGKGRFCTLKMLSLRVNALNRKAASSAGLKNLGFVNLLLKKDWGRLKGSRNRALPFLPGSVATWATARASLRQEYRSGATIPRARRSL
jgi:hypothetical protein